MMRRSRRDDRWFLADDDDAFGGGRFAGGLDAWGRGAKAAVKCLARRLRCDESGRDVFWEFSEHVVEPGGRHAFCIGALPQSPQGRLDSMRLRACSECVKLTYFLPCQQTDVVQFRILMSTLRMDRQYRTRAGLTLPRRGSRLLSGVFSYDSESNNLDFRWDFTDDQIDNFNDAQTANAAVSFPDDGTYFVRLRVTDESGKFDIDSARIQVRNVPPRVDAVATSSPIDEGERLQVQVDASDPGEDQLTYQFDWDGDGVFDTESVADNRVEHRYSEDGQYNAVVRVHDDDGGFVDRTSRSTSSIRHR